MESISILALHGYHGSARTLRRQIAPLADALPPGVNLAFVDAPSLARGDFGWWHEGFTGWEATRDWVAELTAGEHFDGVIGFSQGAALAGLLLATQEAAGDAAGNTALAFGFGFGVMIGGFTSEEPRHAALLRRKLATPSLHVTGSADGIVPMRDSLRLAERFADPVIVEHGGGHVIPTGPRALGRIVEFVDRHGRSRHGDHAATSRATRPHA
jgi:pimeloyl-ACP methyl ester carboxylesterase